MERIGRYKIVRELGRGAMGVVYHAIDPNIGRPVAIKTIQLGSRKPEEQERLRERLLREARSAGILSHPGIVTIYDVEHQGDIAYIAMEYVDGPTLDQLLSESAPIAPARLLNVLAQAAVALDYAHQKGIVHRDIKPANIMIARDGQVKITDFGIAKITASDQLTMTGAIVGTPHYMSPEQVQGHPIDGRTDQFSLGVIAYEALTGEKPYTGEHLTTVVYRIVTEEPALPHRLNPSLAGPIETVLRKGLSKKPDARYGNCQEFVDALEKACAATKGWRLMPRGGSLNEPTIADTAPRSEVTLPPGKKPKRLGDTTMTAARGKDRSGSFLTFLLAILVTGGLIALIALQAPPWLSPAPEPQKTAEAPKAAPPPQPSNPEPPKASPDDSKPSPLTPAEPAPKAEEAPKPEQPKSEPPRKAASTAPQPITIISSPGGARAMLDGRPDAVCTTPCSVDAAPGRHTIAVSLDGYGTEFREVDVGAGPVEMTAVVLRARGGTLMLTSIPAGAKVLVNDKPIPQTTPARINLAPGSYKITIEHDGRQATQNVLVTAGITYLKITL
jgi:serine/threonine-protein kinase